MSRILDAIRESFSALFKDPWLAAPAAALALFDFVQGRIYAALPAGLPSSLVFFLLGAVASGAAAAAYSARLEPYVRARALPLILMYALPVLALGLLSLGALAAAAAIPVRHLSVNLLSGYAHLQVIAGGLLAAVAARSIRPLAEGDGALQSWREGFGDVSGRFWDFTALSALYWLVTSLAAVGLPWPVGPFLAALLLHAMMIGGARRL